MEGKITLSRMAQIGLKTILLSLGISIIFFIPFLPLNIVFSKGIILTLGAAIGLIFWFLDSITTGKFTLPRGRTWLIFLGLVLASVATSFFISNPLNSFIGSGFDTYTVSTLAIGFIYYFLFSVWGSGINFTKYIIKTVYLSGFVVLFFSVIQFVFNITGKYNNVFIGLNKSNLIGSFHDLAMFLGAFVFVLLISLENNFWKGWMKIISTLALIVSLVFLMMINYSFVWYLVGFGSLAIIIYKLMPEPKSADSVDSSLEVRTKNVSFSVISFLVTFCAFVGIVGASSITQFFVQKSVNFIVSEPRPSISATLTIAKNAYYHNPITSVGLNRFNIAWEAGKHKILGGKLIGSQYWNTSFGYSTSVFFTFVITLGLVGAVLFIWLVLRFIKEIIGLFSKNITRNARTRDLFVFSLLSIYSLIIMLFDTPNTFLFILIIALFAMVSSYKQNLLKQTPKEFVFINDYRHSFFGILSILAAIILTTLAVFVMFRAFYASYLVNKAAIESNSKEKISSTISNLTQAVTLHPIDSYARLLSDANLIQVSYTLANKDLSEESLKSLFKDQITAAVNSAKLAISIDPKNYQNYESLLKIQESLISLGDTSSYNDAISIADKILTLAPNNIGIMLREAKLAAFIKDYDASRGYINNILAINPTFIDAYLLRSQIALSEGDTAKAINEIDQAATVNPSSATLQYQKGLIYMNQSNYSKAAESFENALRLAPNSMDVYSSLALAYEKLGQRDSVIHTLEMARNYIVDKTEINALIERVKNGGSLISTQEPVVKEVKDSATKTAQ